MPDVSASYGRPFDFIAFLRFHTLLSSIHVKSTVSSSNFHRLRVLLMYIFWNANMQNVTAGYGRFSDSIAFLWVFFHIITTCLKRYNFIKLLQTVC